MKNITTVFRQIYQPKKALLIYQSEEKQEEIYIEAFDIGANGKPINAHPLSLQEITGLAQCLNVSAALRQPFLKPQGLLPQNVLYLNPDSDGYCIWHTPAQNASLLFITGLHIPCGIACIPALVWKAGKGQVSVFALKSSGRPGQQTELYRAPFFNIHADGSVCMGTVDIDFGNTNCLEDFISAWQQYFFGSYFSHLIGEVSPVEGNIVQLWQGLINTGEAFPATILKNSGKTIKDLIR